MELMMTDKIRRRWARMVLKEYGDYLRLSDPETYAWLTKEAA